MTNFTEFPHRFNIGDEVFVRRFHGVTKQTIDRIEFVYRGENTPVNVLYGYWIRSEQNTVNADDVFATAEEAFK